MDFPCAIQQVGQDDGVNGEPMASDWEEEVVMVRCGYSCPIAFAEVAQLHAECCSTPPAPRSSGY